MVLTVLIIYRCGEVCFQFRCQMNLPKGKEGVEECYALVIVERRAICHVQIGTNSQSPMGASEYIQFVSWIHGLRALKIERESRAAECNERGTVNEKKS